MLKPIFTLSAVIMLLAASCPSTAEPAAEAVSARNTAAVADRPTVGPPTRQATGGAAQKRALIVAIAAYPDGLGYGRINSDRDLPLIEAALKRQGFTDIRLLRDDEADRAGLVAALDHLIDDAQPGDVVLVHFSGHGDQITDDDGDELDGYDEVLVPYGAPAAAAFATEAEAAAYTGDRHLRDDDMGGYVARLRQKVGAEGNVVVWLDACHSGTGTRNAGGPQARGSTKPIGPPATSRGDAQGEEAGGVFEEAPASRGAASGLAPFVVFSAARQGELNYEARDEHNQSVGSLSLAVTRALASLQPGETYRALFDRLSVQMTALAPMQSPQVEGDADTEVFSGQAVPQAAYVHVLEMPEAALAVLDGGTLAGLMEGTRVAFYPIGTTNPEAAEAAPLAAGTVDFADASTADVKLDAPAPSLNLRESWAFVTAYGFGPMRVEVHLAGGLSPETHAALEEKLSGLAVVTLVEAGGELVVDGDAAGAVSLRTVTGGGHIWSAEAGTRAGAVEDAVGERVLDYARNRYLKTLTLTDDEVEVHLELVPATHTFDRRGRCTSSDTTQYGAVMQAGYWELHEDDGYLLRLRNVGTDGAYVAVLDLMPDGEISQLFPQPDLSADEAFVQPGQAYLIEGLCFTAAPPYGNEVLKLFATSQAPLDLRPILTTRGASRSAVQAAGPLQQVFADVQSGTRSKVSSVPGGDMSTHAIKITVKEDPR